MFSLTKRHKKVIANLRDQLSYNYENQNYVQDYLLVLLEAKRCW